MVARSVDFDVVGWGPRHGLGNAEVVHYGFGQRVARSMKSLVLTWAVAIPLMFIPYAVVVVMPSAILLSLFFVVQHMRAPEVATVCSGTCPDCGRQQRFDVPEQFHLPLEIQCGNCHRELWLRKRDNAAVLAT